MNCSSKVLCILVAAGFLLAPVFLAGSSLCPEAEGAEGKIKKLEGKLKDRKGGSISKADGLLVYFLVDFFVNIAPHLLFPEHKYNYQEYPYATGEGYPIYLGASPHGAPDTIPLTARQITFELRADYHVDSAELHGYRFFGKTRLSWAFNVDFELTQFKEWKNLYTFDVLTLGRVDGLFNVSSSPWHDVDLGFGVSYIDGLDFFAGLNVKLSGDIFPHRPFGIHFSACANAFEGGVLYDTELAFGVFLRRFEFRVGFRAIWVDGMEILGPMTGIAIWF
ncbi:MAG: hypothetical protein ACYTFG_05030 [Planctomycetota bacterium]|jgi:hypothetical protein